MALAGPVMPEGHGRAGRGPGRTVRADETPELRRLRRRIDALDQRIVGLLNERTALGLETGRVKAGAGRPVVRDPDREREVLMRVALANTGPLPQAELLALYRRLMAATRELEARLLDLGRAFPTDPRAGRSPARRAPAGPVSKRPAAEADGRESEPGMDE